MNNENASVRIDNVTKQYGSTNALDRIDLDIAAGEFMTLLGPSGSGKTTLLNVIAGAIVPDAGRVFIGGVDVTTVPPRKRNLGMVFQSYALMPHMTVAENIAFPLKIRGVDASTIASRVKEALDLVRLPEFGSRKPRQLSGGQQQRVAIARCLVYRPPIILMDEPLGALDKNLRDQMQSEIKRLHKTLGVSIIYVTHDQEEAFSMSDRVCLMGNGQIADLGSPVEIFERPRTRFAAEFFGCANVFEASHAGTGSDLSWSDGIIRGQLAAETDTKAVTWAIRPEKIRRSRSPSACVNSTIGVVTDVTFVGSTVRNTLMLRSGATLTFVEMNNGHAELLRNGQQQQVEWEAGAIVQLK